MSTSPDISGWCATGRHDHCDGVLRTATGYHWWCACTHHDPIPKPDPAKIKRAGTGDVAEHRKAWAVWRKARNAQESA
jgi:hypothetical protein